jgi:hypothetical protein
MDSKREAMTDENKPKRGRPATGNGKPRQLGRVHDGPWEKLQKAAKIAGGGFTQWALDILLREADAVIEADEQKKKRES